MATEIFINLTERYNRRVVIAMKGLPCTMKTVVAKQIGRWVQLPALYIDDFIGALNNNNKDGDDSWEEAERLHLSVIEQAFTTLCRVAGTQVHDISCSVIKSRLSSTSDLDLLFQLLDGYRRNIALLIIECRVRNKHQWHNRFNDVTVYERKWNRPRRWNDIEKAIADHFHPQYLADWDHQLQRLIQPHLSIKGWGGKDPILVRRLVVDPHYDLGLPSTQASINPIFAHAINHFLSAELEDQFNDQNPYVVEFDDFRRSRAKEILNSLTPFKRSRDVCGVNGCLFKYIEELRFDEDDVEGNNCCCGVCDQKVISGEPGYTCHYCILTLHKPCAELIHFNPRTITMGGYWYLSEYICWGLPANEKHACNSHLQKFTRDCDWCLFRTVLKGGMLPAVVNHYDHHPHPLSLIIRDKNFICKACGVRERNASYACRICEWYFHIQCPFMPRELEHVHGGHEHELKLKYSHEDKEQEDYWCDVCFKDLDPYYWYYSCPSCPYYAAHLYCVGLYPPREASLLWQYALYF